MNIGSAICLARKNLGFTKKEFADKVGLSPSTITRIENGERSMSLQVTQDIASALGFKLSQLITIAESILKPEDEIKDLKRKLLLSVQPILSQCKTINPPQKKLGVTKKSTVKHHHANQ